MVPEWVWSDVPTHAARPTSATINGSRFVRGSGGSCAAV